MPIERQCCNGLLKISKKLVFILGERKPAEMSDVEGLDTDAAFSG